MTLDEIVLTEEGLVAVADVCREDDAREVRGSLG
jgi:hypothetical protein